MKSVLVAILLSCFFLLSLMPGKEKQIIDMSLIDKHLKYIPASSFNMIERDGMSRVVSVSPFYIHDQEVTNGEYLFYLHSLIKSGDTALARKALPDTTVWLVNRAYNPPYMDYYFRHPAYRNYPVVGVSYEQCIEFCAWLTKMYAGDPSHKLKNATFSLPTEAQWTAAASSKSPSVFPWEGPFMQNEKGKWMANFKVTDPSSIRRSECDGKTIFIAEQQGERMGIAGTLNDASDVTAPAISFWPNGYGLYNMSGNVEEFILEKGFSKGGSWYDTGYYLKISSREEYDTMKSSSAERGFRVVANF
jgi:formylglycine-generating enzyme required for sulfatase activity